jgi:hypothetical protein
VMGYVSRKFKWSTIHLLIFSQGIWSKLDQICMKLCRKRQNLSKMRTFRSRKWANLALKSRKRLVRRPK